MRRFRSTLVLVTICLALFGYIYFFESKRPATTVDDAPLAFAVESDAIDELRIAPRDGESSLLRKTADGWDLVEPAEADADDVEAGNLAQAIASLEIRRVVDEDATDLAQYGLEEPTVDVAFQAAGDAAPTHLLVGDKTPTGSEVYARTGDTNRVFLIASFLERSFNKTTFDLRDKAILKFERDQVTGLDVSSARGTVGLAKEGSDWTLSEPLRASADFSSVEGLVGQIQSGRMTSLIATDAEDLSEYGLDQPVASATVLADSVSLTLEVGAPAPGGSVYARDTSRPLVFTIPATLVTALDKSAADFRRKDLFDFRSFNATSLALTREGTTTAFEMVSGESDSDEDESAADTWRKTSPDSGEIDTAAFQSAIAQLSALRIESYADDGATGLDAPIAEVSVTFDEGTREERVTFGRVGDTIYAARSDEPGAAVVNTETFERAMMALDDLR